MQFVINAALRVPFRSGQGRGMKSYFTRGNNERRGLGASGMTPNDFGGRPVWNGTEWVTPQSPRKKNRGWKIAGGVAGVLVVAGLVGSLGDDDNSSSVASTVTETVTQTRQSTAVSTTTSISATTTTTTTTTAPPVTTTESVPDPNLPDPNVPNPGIPYTPDPSLGISSPPIDVGVYYSDCAEARAAGAAPIYRDEPGYRSELDRNNDGVACES